MEKRGGAGQRNVVENGEVEVPFIGPQREQSGRPAGFGGEGGVNGGWPLQEGEREATGQCRFNGETEGGDSALRFNSFHVREGDGRRRWRLGRYLMKVTTPGSLTGWAHLSATAESDKWSDSRIGQAERRPNRTSSEREVTGRLGRTGREEMGRGWARREERRPGRNYFLG
jgi:hypothetical protein